MLYFIFFNIKEFIFSFTFFRSIFLYKLHRYSKLEGLKELNLNDKSIFLDFGGNNGVVSQYIHDKYKCYIDIYEPHKGCFKILKDKFYNNKKIKIYNSAISNTDGYKKFYFHYNVKNNDYYNLSLSESSSLESKKKNISKKKFEFVKCKNINHVFKDFSFIDVIKVDIEGHEYRILPSLFKNIKKIGKIFIEFHGKTHHENFKKNYNQWIKKINNSAYKNKFIDW
jgi:FkbM family methyltransferase